MWHLSAVQLGRLPVCCARFRPVTEVFPLNFESKQPPGTLQPFSPVPQVVHRRKLLHTEAPVNCTFPWCYRWKRTEIDCQILHSERHCRVLDFNSSLDSQPVPVLGTGNVPVTGKRDVWSWKAVLSALFRPLSDVLIPLGCSFGLLLAYF